MPAGLMEMLKIPGFGPKRAKLLYEKLRIDTVEKLEAACNAGRSPRSTVSVKNRSKKSSKASRWCDSSVAAITITRRWRLAQPIIEALRAHDGVIRCSIAGSLRRRRETIGDIDFLVSAKPKDAPGDH